MLKGLPDKINRLRSLIDQKGLSTTITIDGRTYLELIPDYIARGADAFVAGTSCLFRKNGMSVGQNFAVLKNTVDQAVGRKGII